MIQTIQKKFRQEQLTSAVLIVANLIPLVGVLFYQWDLKTVMLLYWLENLIVGLMNIVRILFIAQDQAIIQRLGASAFFTVHYGIFCLGHGSLLFELLSIRIEGVETMFSPFEMVKELPIFYMFLQQTLTGTTSIALLSMLLSHSFSLQTHFFKAGERKRVTVSYAMRLPYQRIIVMHIGLMAGTFLIEEFGATILLLVALIIAKIVADVMYHRKEHRRLAVDVKPSKQTL